MRDPAKQATEAIFGSFVAAGTLAAVHILLGMGDDLLLFKSYDEATVFTALFLALLCIELALYNWQIKKASAKNPSPERKIFVVIWATILVAIPFFSKDSTLFISDQQGFLNTLIQISGLTIGSAFIVAVFLIQSSIQNERDAASDYVRLLGEAHRMKSDEKQGHSAYLERVHSLMKGCEARRESEKNTRKDLLLPLMFSIMPFIASIIICVPTMLGIWSLLWLSLSLVIIGSSYYVWIIGVFLAYCYPAKKT